MSEAIYTVTNPATGEVEETFPTATDDEVMAALERAYAARERWRKVPLEEKIAIIERVAAEYDSRQEELARIIGDEMGKPYGDATGEVWLSGDIHAYNAKHAPEVLADEELDLGERDGRAYMRKEPVGVIVGVMPWNYPYYQVARFAAPNLLLGNVILLKHAPQCPRSAKVIEEIYHAAGVPKDVYQNLYATNEQIAMLIDDPRVQGVSLTGSERAGSAVGERAGRNLKKAVLELGGSDPFIVLPDADIDKAVEDGILGRFENSGQACNAAKRFILIGDETYDKFVPKFAEAVAGLKMGDPHDESTNIGPLVTEAAAKGIQARIDDAVDAGAEVVVGGKRPDGPGAYVTPTVLAGVTPQMRAWSEEIFGPVAVMYKAADEDEAVRIANDTLFGLGASVHSADVDAALRVADRLESGMVSINEAPGSSSELPFGGVKRSGFGRELGTYGFDEFCNKRMIRIAG